MEQFLITPAAGKQLIAGALLEHEMMKKTIETGTVVIVAGTTNGYVAEAWLKKLGQEDGFRRDLFYRGITLPPGEDTAMPPAGFPGDVVINKGKWLKGKTIFDVADDLKEGDIILKGANSLDLRHRKAGVFIAHPRGGTTLTLLQAVIGRRVHLIIPAGLEKRIDGDPDAIAARVNAPGSRGLRLMPLSGEIITEIEALDILFGVKATLMAGGGVAGAEGAIWLAVEGEKQQMENASGYLATLAKEPPFFPEGKGS